MCSAYDHAWQVKFAVYWMFGCGGCLATVSGYFGAILQAVAWSYLPAPHSLSAAELCLLPPCCQHCCMLAQCDPSHPCCSLFAGPAPCGSFNFGPWQLYSVSSSNCLGYMYILGWKRTLEQTYPGRLLFWPAMFYLLPVLAESLVTGVPDFPQVGLSVLRISNCNLGSLPPCSG